MPSEVVVAHNAVADSDDPSTRDVLDQVTAVSQGLAELELDFRCLAVHEGSFGPGLKSRPGLVVFNLVEAPPGRPRQQHAVAQALERLGVDFTGSGSAAIWRTTDKIETRVMLTAAGVAVAAGGAVDPERPVVLDDVPPPWVVKPAWEDASVGLEGSALCATRERAVERVRELAARFPGQPILAEHFLPGREFNLSLLAEGGGVEVMPVAELAYVDFPDDEPRILGYEAKWEPDSFAYTHTVRRFLDDGEAGLARQLAATARRAWEVSGVSGYARVDMRLDDSGAPCVLEVNANPCLSADAGFVAATRQSGLSMGQVVRRILAAASREAS